MQNNTVLTSDNDKPTNSNETKPYINENGNIVNPLTGEIFGDVNSCSPDFLLKLLDAKLKIGVIKKNQSNAAQGYKFANLTALAQAIYPILYELKIDFKISFSHPYIKEYTKEIRDKKDKYGPSTYQNIKALFVDVKGVVYNIDNPLSDNLEMSIPMPIDTQQHNITQGMGSSLSYGRRYWITGIFGITYDDREDIDYDYNNGDNPPVSKQSLPPAATTPAAAPAKKEAQPAAAAQAATKPAATLREPTTPVKTATKTVADRDTLEDKKTMIEDDYQIFKKYCIATAGEDRFKSVLNELGAKKRNDVTYALKDKALKELNLTDDFINYLEQQGSL